MPPWQPNWENVRWDWGAADEAVAALRAAADKIEVTLAERLRSAAEAQREWRGRYREEFDAELEGIKSRAQGLAAEYRAAADRIRSASQRAYEEQRHREGERERWRRDKEDADRRDREQQGSRY